MDCLGSALRIREHRGIIYIDTHYNPSAGCVIVLGSRLELRAAVSGWLVGLVGAEYAIVQESEIHFLSVHPMHIAVFDVGRNQLREIYPYKNDPHRRRFTRSLEPYISEKWCVESNAQCDPENFNTDLRGDVIVNEGAKVFGFHAQFDPIVLDPAAETRVPSRTVTYIFRKRGGDWQHREFAGQPLRRLLDGMSLKELISNNPGRAFQRSSGK